MPYELYLRSTRYPADLNGITHDNIPGGPLAEDIAEQLRERGYREVRVVESEPLWLVEVGTGKQRLTIVVLLFEPHDIRAQALWIASLESALSLWGRWRKKPEDAAVLALAKALEASARAIKDLRVVRRKGDWP
ncbi:MAG TPA: hypothetical protein VN153_12835 [Tahibacter sp.]|nr:hypothetical protein [Tahibacter sp.]